MVIVSSMGANRAGGIIARGMKRRGLTPTWLACVNGLDQERIEAVLTSAQPLSRETAIKIGNAIAQPCTYAEGKSIGEIYWRIQQENDFTISTASCLAMMA